MDMRCIEFNPGLKEDEAAVHQNYFDSLPDELVIRILSNLDVSEICPVWIVCRRFLALSKPVVVIVSTSAQLQQAIDNPAPCILSLLPGIYEVSLPIISPTVIRGIGPSPSSVVLRLPRLILPTPSVPVPYPFGIPSHLGFWPLLTCGAPTLLSNLTLECNAYRRDIERRECVSVVSGGKLYLKDVHVSSKSGLGVHVQGPQARLCINQGSVSVKNVVAEIYVHAGEIIVTDDSEDYYVGMERRRRSEAASGVSELVAAGLCTRSSRLLDRWPVGVLVCEGGQAELTRTRVSVPWGVCVGVMAKSERHVHRSVFYTQTRWSGHAGEAWQVEGTTDHVGKSLSVVGMIDPPGSDSNSEAPLSPASAVVTTCSLESSEVLCVVGSQGQLEVTGCNFGPCSWAVAVQSGTAQAKRCRFDRAAIKSSWEGNVELKSSEFVDCAVTAMASSVVVHDSSFHVAGQGEGQGQAQAQGQEQRLVQGQGQGRGMADMNTEQGQGQRQGWGQGQGQYQGREQGQAQGQGQGNAGQISGKVVTLDVHGGSIEVRRCIFHKAGIVLSGVTATLDKNLMFGDQLRPACAIRMQQAVEKGFAGFVTLTNNELLCGVEAAVVVEGGEARLSSNIIRGIPGAGVVISSGGKALVEDNKVLNTGGCGVNVKNSGDGTVRLNNFDNNGGDGAVRISEGGLGLIERNKVSSAIGAGVLVMWDPAVKATLQGNKIHNCMVGVKVELQPRLKVEGDEDGWEAMLTRRPGNWVRVEDNEF